uniref:C2H2-type domain-containing protein n=1 Tax=Mesocestoides corti TaxID=53468 RepID=A0A5K3FV78_MESCO
MNCYSCKRCHKVLDTTEGLLAHAENVHHVSQSAFFCCACRLAGFSSQAALLRHQTIHCPGPQWDNHKSTGSGLLKKPLDCVSKCGRQRRLSTQSGKSSRKKSTSLLQSSLVNDKIPRRSLTSLRLPEERCTRSGGRRRSLLVSIHPNVSDACKKKTNPKARCGKPNTQASKQSHRVSEGQTIPNNPAASDTSSPLETPPVSVRKSTRMRTMSSSEERRTKPKLSLSISNRLRVSGDETRFTSLKLEPRKNLRFSAAKTLQCATSSGTLSTKADDELTLEGSSPSLGSCFKPALQKAPRPTKTMKAAINLPTTEVIKRSARKCKVSKLPKGTNNRVVQVEYVQSDVEKKRGSMNSGVKTGGLQCVIEDTFKPDQLMDLGSYIVSTPEASSLQRSSKNSSSPFLSKVALKATSKNIVLPLNYSDEKAVKVEEGARPSASNASSPLETPEKPIEVCGTEPQSTSLSMQSSATSEIIPDCGTITRRICLQSIPSSVSAVVHQTAVPPLETSNGATSNKQNSDSSVSSPLETPMKPTVENHVQSAVSSPLETPTKLTELKGGLMSRLLVVGEYPSRASPHTFPIGRETKLVLDAPSPCNDKFSSSEIVKNLPSKSPPVSPSSSPLETSGKRLEKQLKVTKTSTPSCGKAVQLPDASSNGPPTGTDERFVSGKVANHPHNLLRGCLSSCKTELKPNIPTENISDALIDERRFRRKRRGESPSSDMSLKSENCRLAGPSVATAQEGPQIKATAKRQKFFKTEHCSDSSIDGDPSQVALSRESINHSSSYGSASNTSNSKDNSKISPNEVKTNVQRISTLASEKTSTSTPPSGRVALVDWDSFIAGNPRKYKRSLSLQSDKIESANRQLPTVNLSPTKKHINNSPHVAKRRNVVAVGEETTNVNTTLPSNEAQSTPSRKAQCNLSSQHRLRRSSLSEGTAAKPPGSAASSCGEACSAASSRTMSLASALSTSEEVMPIFR